MLKKIIFQFIHLYRGISHHKVCIVSSIDNNNNNLILKDVELVKYTTQMLENALGDNFFEVNSFNTNSASTYQNSRAFLLEE